MAVPNNKVGRYYTVQPHTAEVIKQYSERNGLSQGETIDELVTFFMDKGGTKDALIAQAVIDEFDRRYSADFSRLQSSAKFTDINVEILLDALSTILWWLPNGPTGGSFNGPHQVLRDAAVKVKQQIADNKQKMDNQKG